MPSLLPDTESQPYYIFAPGYLRTSAGIRVLHILCHWLNKSGMRASIASINREAGAARHPDLLTPELTQAGIDLHFEQGKTPILVYPEVISGNPAGGECIVRYVLNFPGLLGGDASYPPNEIVYGFSRQLAENCGVPDQVLHMPVLDTSVYHPAESDEERTETCFYAMKYQHVHNQQVFGLPAGCVEITRDKRDSQSPQEISALFHRSKVFYCFENTALAAEAMLCGCPAVFVPNPYLDRPIALDELGWDGFAWGDDEEAIRRARATVSNGQRNYQRTVVNFFDQLHSFVERTQEVAKNTPYKSKIDLSSLDVHSREIRALISAKRHWKIHDRLKCILSIARA